MGNHFERHAQVLEINLADVVRPDAEIEALLESHKSDGQPCGNGSAHDRAGCAVEPCGYIHRNRRGRRFRDRFHRMQIIALERAVQPRAQHRVHDHIGFAAQLLAELHHAPILSPIVLPGTGGIAGKPVGIRQRGQHYVEPRGPGQSGYHVAVARVVAGTAQHEPAACIGIPASNRAKGRFAGPAHQRVSGDAGLLNSQTIHLPHVGRRVDEIR